MSPNPVSPAAPRIAISNLEISRTNAASSSIAVGETLEVTVLEKIAGNKYLLAIKNMSIPASSEVPLNIGEKIQIKVSSLQPQIILNFASNQKLATEPKINEKLMYWRTNPDSLLQLLSKSGEFVKDIQAINLPLKFSKSEIDKLIKLFDSITFSNNTKGNNLFLKDLIVNTGLLLENKLSRLVTEGAKGINSKPFDDNIKTLLLKLSAGIQELLKDSEKLDPQIKAKLMNIAGFTTEALKTIEARQAINIVFQESDNGLVLQVPLSVADGLRQADIFIRPDDKNNQDEKNYSSCSIMIFLDLDILGKISVNASVREGSLRSLIKCEREDVKDIISRELSKLESVLAGIGYRVDYIDCLQEDELTQEREEYFEEQSFSGVDLVNYFA
ncbi:MAG: flagellar hook-length control protein FliK [Deltaproteobacteria bacterium]